MGGLRADGLHHAQDAAADFQRCARPVAQQQGGFFDGLFGEPFGQAPPVDVHQVVLDDLAAQDPGIVGPVVREPLGADVLAQQGDDILVVVAPQAEFFRGGVQAQQGVGQPGGGKSRERVAHCYVYRGDFFGQGREHGDEQAFVRQHQRGVFGGMPLG